METHVYPCIDNEESNDFSSVRAQTADTIPLTGDSDAGLPKPLWLIQHSNYFCKILQPFK